MSPTAERQAEATEAALELFWRRGYVETSMAELVEATGMNRYALYLVFGNKREVFLAALDAYYETGRATYEPMMRDRSMAPLDRIRRGLETAAAFMSERENGCFICHVAVEHRSGDAKVSAAVASYFDRIREIMTIPLREAAAAGSLNPSLTPELAAQVVFAAKMSLGAHVRAGCEPPELQRIIEATLAALGAPDSD